jgi:hypothetical protein
MATPKDTALGKSQTPQKVAEVPQHKRLAQGDTLPANQAGKGVQKSNA